MKKKSLARELVFCVGVAAMLATVAGNVASGADRQKRAPHGGTPVLIADHKFHLELVRDETTGVMQAYVLDDHLEKPVSVGETNFTLKATFEGRTEQLEFKRVGNAADGKAPSSLFEGRADWIKGATNFTGHIASITLSGQTFTNISFPFPKGTQHTH